MGVFAICLSRSGHSFALAAVNLTLVGFFGGLFAVPLNALLQQKSGDEEKGRLMATNNFLNMLAIMLASGALWLCRDVLAMTADRIILRLRRADAASPASTSSASCPSSWSASACGC